MEQATVVDNGASKPAVVEAVSEVADERISDQDRHTLEMAVMQRKLAVANAEKALAENNAAELAHKHIVLQIYVKYGMDLEKDSIDEQGAIKRNSVTPEQLEQMRQQAQAQSARK